MIVQIYEITSVNEAIQISGVGADHIGVWVGEGGRDNEVRSFKAKEIFLSLPKDKKGVALTFASNIDEIIKLVRDSEPDILHLASNLEEISPELVGVVKKEFPSLEMMITIPVIGEESVVAAMMYDGVYDYLFLDTKDKITGQIGITGKTHNWEISKKIVDSVSTKIILAGGLGPDNVEEAIKTVHPYGVDSHTKTDKIGSMEKDIIKVKIFADKAKSVKITE